MFICSLPQIQSSFYYLFLINNKTFMSVYLFNLCIVFLLFLWVISKNILMFSKAYMTFWSFYFHVMMALFIGSMMLLIMCNSWLLLFFSWELLGLTSFLLILYYNNWNSVSGSLLTIMTNRLGDAFFMMSLSFFMTSKSNMMVVIIVIMSLTKSAQFPFSSWLPAAMAAPTPVSSLVHSSTLVTAGIYVFFRFNMMFNLVINSSLMLVFMVTMMVGSLSALVESDLKKLIAFSTLSQLGLIFMSFYTCVTGLVFFHLLVHAIFKSILFMIAGLVIWSMSSQSLDLSFSLTSSLSCLLVISIMNMMGFSFLSGFISKDMLIFSLGIKSVLFSVFMLMIISLTLFYSWRLLMVLLSNLIFSKNCFNFVINKITLFYMMSMMMMGRIWVNNWIWTLNFTMIYKLTLTFMLGFLVFNHMKLSIFKNLISINTMMTNFVFMNVEKDGLNFFLYGVYSLQTKLVNWKIMMMMWMMLIMV